MEKRLKFTSFYEGPVPVYTRSVTPLFLAALLAPSSTSLLVAIVDPLPLGHHVNVHVTCLLPVSLQEVLLRKEPGNPWPGTARLLDHSKRGCGPLHPEERRRFSSAWLVCKRHWQIWT